MIELQLYRIHIGSYNNTKGGHSMRKARKNKDQTNSNPKTGKIPGEFLYQDCAARNFSMLSYLYFIIIILCLTMSMAKTLKAPSTLLADTYHQTHNMAGGYVLMSYVKYFYCIIFSYAIKSIVTKNPYRNKCDSPPFRGFESKNVRYNIFYKLFVNFSINMLHIRQLGRLNKVVQSLFLWQCIINFLLIAIVNPSLLNPGPSCTKSTKLFSVHYQNVQGLIPFGDLNEKYPTLNTTKIHEIGLYLQANNPDVIVLNETWLKSSILDNEVIPIDKYEVFRLDRTKSTHPPDPNNPKKFRQSGGGVLIGVRKNIGVTCKVIPIRCKAEILSVELKESSGRKTIISSFYRVGTLGIENHSAVENYITKIRRRRNVTGIVLVGDMNFPKVNWTDFVSTDNIEQLFLNTFSNLSLEQLVNIPTHIKGNILDYIITDISHLIKNISVDSNNLMCGSDHYLIKFNMPLNKIKQKLTKRSIYNFKRAKWDDINSDFSKINWHSLLASNNIEDALVKFESKFFSICNKHIPKIKISNEFKPPWYDSEVFELDREKNRLHGKAKKSGSDLYHAKFAACKKELNELIKKKMDSNFEDENNRNLVTKKLHSYVKSRSNSHRIPEIVSYGSKLKSKKIDQCNLFNQYFLINFRNPAYIIFPLTTHLIINL